MKRFLSILVALSLLVGMLVFDVSAAATSGTCGDNLTWKIENKILIISGTGDMYDYSKEEGKGAPWSGGFGFTRVRIASGVTSIGDYAFWTLSGVNLYEIAATVKYVGSGAFGRPSSASGGSYMFYGDAPEFAEDAFIHRNTKCYTLRTWDETDKPRELGFGSYLTWRPVTMQLNSKCKMLYELNEEIKPEDMVFSLLYGSDITSSLLNDLVPSDVTFGTYDHSTYGQKTVKVFSEGMEFEHTYYVTDGQNHLDLIRVDIGTAPEYNEGSAEVEVTVKAGSLTLRKNTDYSLDYFYSFDVGFKPYVTIRGKGIYEGFYAQYSYPIIRREIGHATRLDVNNTPFLGSPVEGRVSIGQNGDTLEYGTDYTLLYENNVNVGKGKVKIMGLGNYCGYTEREFSITQGPMQFTLKGNYLGQADGELSDDIAYSEYIVTPGVVSLKPNCLESHIAVYALYRVDLETGAMELVDEFQSDYAVHTTQYTYDFTSIYEGEENSGEVYMLACSWVTGRNEVYGGAALLAVPSKVGPATAMELTQAEDGDFRMDFLAANGTDGALGDITWKTSDSSIATVEKGNVTFKRPGTVSVTAQSGNLSASKQLTQETLDITEAVLYDYSEESGARVIYDYRLLEEGTDYTLSVEQKDGQNIVTVTGCGLFKGQLVRSFDAGTGEGADHTHTYASACETTCTGCQETRPGGHSYSTDWSKNTTHHWHECAACGDQTDKAEHTLAAGDSSTCTTCGKLYLPGDFNGDWLVTDADVIWLLWYTVFPEDYPLVSSGDFNGDSLVTDADVIYLLWHTVFPEDYPLN